MSIDKVKDSLTAVENALQYCEKTDQKDSVGRKSYLISEEWLLEIEKAVHEALYASKFKKSNSVIHDLTYDTNQHI